MTVFFADTSALAKRYLKEVGSGWVLDWILPAAGNVTFHSEIAMVEMFSLLARRQREGSITLAARNTLQSNFLAHARDEYVPVPVDTHVLEEARGLLNRHPLRTLDAIQLASAIRARLIIGEPLTLISADKSLLAAASASGVPTDNPLDHP